MRTLITAAASFIFTNTMAQNRDSIIYPVTIQFLSECCGVPGDAPLKKFLKDFKKQHKIKSLAAWHIGPMGREGEYYLAFPLKELNKKQALLFTDKIKDRGSAVCVENMKIAADELPARASTEKVIF